MIQDNLLTPKTFVCIGSGPSLTRGQLNYLEEVHSQNRDKIKVIAVNSSVYVYPRANILFAADRVWWKNNINDINSSEEITSHFCTLKGIKKFLKKNDLPFDDKRFTEYECLPGTFGLNLDGNLNHGGNSGHMAVNLAWNLGAEKIILIGYDYQHTHNKAHFFGDYPNDVYPANATNTERWVENFKYIAGDLRQLQVDLVNCSGVTAIDSCPKGNLFAELKSIK